MTNRDRLSNWHPATIISTWFWIGKLPFAPGTMGSLAALPMAFVIQSWFGNYFLAMVALGIFVLGWLAAYIYMEDSTRSDPAEIVIDEVAGQCLLLSFLYPTMNAYILGFVLFRIFDIWKPWPISLADKKIGGGFGVMFDDILAAIFPLLLWLAFVKFIPLFDPLFDANDYLKYIKPHVF